MKKFSALILLALTGCTGYGAYTIDGLRDPKFASVAFQVREPYQQVYQKVMESGALDARGMTRSELLPDKSEAHIWADAGHGAVSEGGFLFVADITAQPDGSTRVVYHCGRGWEDRGERLKAVFPGA